MFVRRDIKGEGNFAQLRLRTHAAEKSSSLSHGACAGG